MKFKNNKFFAILVVTTILLIGSVKADLTSEINGIIKQSSQKKVQFSVNVIKADTGEVVYSYRAYSGLLPASNMKLIITAAALKYLGPNYVYKTQVGFCKDVLVIKGSGDPLLGEKDSDSSGIFNDIAGKLILRRIVAINGVIVDSSVFDDERVHPNWAKEELNRPYACEVSGLNFNTNCVDVMVKNRSGKISIFLQPATRYLKVINKVKAITKGKSAVGSYRNRQPNNITVFGKCKKREGPFLVAIERPAVYFGILLTENLTKAGIMVSGRLVEKAIDKDCNFKVIKTYQTPIAACLARANKDSFGLAAEALLKTIATKANSEMKNGSWADGQKMISAYLVSLGIEEDEFNIDDGSGLSRKNRLSANAISKVLLDTYKSKDWGVFEGSLAVGGTDGTIKKYFKDDKYRGKILGKTGYISGVKSFSGVCKTQNGDFLFSIITNKANAKTRPIINDIAKAVIDNNL